MFQNNVMQHWLTRQMCNYHRKRFITNSNHIKKTQSNILTNLINQSKDCPANSQYGLTIKDNWQSFAQKVPITGYNDYQPWIDRAQLNQHGNLCQSPIERYQPTSGSTSSIKWIPYTSQFLSEINRALMAWMGELYLTYPGIQRGYHYWSISCIPTSLRDQVDDNVNDDLNVLPWWERWIISRFMAVPDSVALANTSDDTVFATLTWLITRRDLTFISVWSPTFALTLIELIKTYRGELIEVLKSGDWLSRSVSLKHTQCPKDIISAKLLHECKNISDSEILIKLWPKLSLISCWDTSSSSIWADKLHKLLPFAQLEGKGLFATEGVVTIPFAGKYPLAVNSHYYEFLDLDNDIVIPSWQLEKGMNVAPIMSTGSGFLRYKLNDRLVVTDFYNELPCFQFLGRNDGTDMAGEKISTGTAIEIINKFRTEYELTPICLLAIPGHKMKYAKQQRKGKYILLCSKNSNHKDGVKYSVELEKSLCEHFHYKLARELSQLESASVLMTDKASEIYHFRCHEQGMVDGNIKVEPLVIWNTRLHPELDILKQNDQEIYVTH